MQLAINPTALTTVPQPEEQHSPDTQIGSSTQTQVKFGQLLAEQTELGKETKPTSSTVFAMFSSPAKAKDRMDSLTRPGRGLPSNGETEPNDLAKRQSNVSEPIFQAVDGFHSSDSQNGGNWNSIGGDDTQDLGNKSLAILRLQRKTDERPVGPTLPSASVVMIVPSISVAGLPANDAVFSPQHDALSVQSKPTVNSHSLSKSMEINPAIRNSGIQQGMDGLVASEEANEVGAKTCNILMHHPTAIHEDGSSDVIQADSGVTDQVRGELSDPTTLDEPKGGGEGRPSTGTSVVASSSSATAEARVSQLHPDEIKAESSLRGHSTQSDHASTVEIPILTSSQSPSSPMLSGVHPAGSAEAAAFLGVPRAQHGVGPSGNLTINPYQKLDEGAAPSMTLKIGANRMAFGMHDPALGWVEIKTQSTEGQISAALITASSQTHEALAAQLPALAHFLTEHQVKIGSLAVEQHSAAPDDGGRSSPGKGQEPNAQSRDEGASSTLDPNPTFDSIGLDNERVFEERPLSYIDVRA